MQLSLSGAHGARAFNNRLQQHQLPNGFNVRHISMPAEVQFHYNEQYVQQVYLQNQVALKPGDVVLDVGANIGMFAMFAAEIVGESGLVLCCEPAPAAAAALTENLVNHASWQAAAGRQVASTDIVRAAVSDASQTSAILTTYNKVSGWSTLIRDDEESLSNVQLYINHVIGKAEGAQQMSSAGSSSRPGDGTRQADVADDGLDAVQQILFTMAGFLRSVPFLASATQLLIKLYIEQAIMRDVSSVSCDVVTVSQLIQDYNLSTIDLLKVDVERAEWQVLQGVQQQHWPLIQQVAMEVHDLNGRLDAVVQLLYQQGGFRTVSWEQEPQMLGTTLYNVYAVR